MGTFGTGDPDQVGGVDLTMFASTPELQLLLLCARIVLKGGSFVGDVKNFTPATHAAGPANGGDVRFRVRREVP